MSYSVEHRTWAETVSRAVNFAIALLCVLLVPYFLFVGSFWGAPLEALLVQIFWISVLPLLSMYFSNRWAKRAAAEGRQRTAAIIRFLPAAVFLFVGPLLAWFTKLVGMELMGR